LAGQTPPGARPNKRAVKVLGRGPRVGRLTLMVTLGLDGWSPPRLGRGTELGLQVYSPQKNFPALYAAKDKDETQALTKGLFKEKTRGKIASQQP
jgi:hypothetical protein